VSCKFGALSHRFCHIKGCRDSQPIDLLLIIISFTLISTFTEYLRSCRRFSTPTKACHRIRGEELLPGICATVLP